MERGNEMEDGQEYRWTRGQSYRMLQGMLSRVGHVPFRPNQASGATTPSDPKCEIFKTMPSDPKHEIVQTPLLKLKEDCASYASYNKEYPVYENVLLIGEEKCVEDWPEDSPELRPDWKPSGRLRLRRESMKVLSETQMEGKKIRRFSLSIPSRRGSKIEAEPPEKGADLFKGREGEEDEQDVVEECRLQTQKRGKKFRITLQRRVSKSDTEPPEKGADLFKGREGEEDEQDVVEECSLQTQKRGKKFRITFLQRRVSKSDIEPPEKGAHLFKGREGEEDEQDVVQECRLQTQKRGKKFSFLQHRDSKAAELPETTDGATCSNYSLSEAAEAEWLAAQRDDNLIGGEKIEEMGDVEDGDTDSLMEWWNTVEQWDELPSDDEDLTGEGEVMDLTVLAEKVQKGIHVFNKVFMEQAECLLQHIIDLNTISENIIEFHRKAKKTSITGGTTSAVGGAAAIAGLALAPFTLGVSLIITAVGIGVATAGGAHLCLCHHLRLREQLPRTEEG
ncbi:hypothetical protein SKAU_G00032760 [Synaphobranchus kaupii]|uniref:Uncharacterized protein n=1 Tax=Synaphobranchus kaupii TaxID=118154 RepID=A0A9Q1JEC4_SYNKA|nr:hypothetical protein SKAU_G00032760 [Synaphobranchus kaupii]